MSASSRPRADCSTSSRAAGPGPRDGCKIWGSNGFGESGLSRAGYSGVISPPIPERFFCCSTRTAPQAPIKRREANMNDRPAILVTGGAGYIGSHCCRALATAGYHPIVYDNLSTGHRNFVTGSLVVGELLDKAMLTRTFAQHDIVAVMHLAASSAVGESVAEPQKYYWNNIV